MTKLFYKAVITTEIVPEIHEDSNGNTLSCAGW